LWWCPRSMLRIGLCGEVRASWLSSFSSGLLPQVGDLGCPIQVVGSIACFMQVEIAGSSSGFPVQALASQVGDPGCPTPSCRFHHLLHASRSHRFPT
jgi:hypothetical protein